MRVSSRLAAAVMAAGLTTAGLAVTSAPAFAQADSDCTARISGPMCYYYRSSYGGARAGITIQTPDLAVWTFSGHSDGNGRNVANNAGSGSNRDKRCTATTWEHVGGPAGGGSSIKLNPYGKSGYQHSTLGALNNNNRSLYWNCA